MASKQVREILDQIRDMHQKMSGCLKAVNASSHDARMQFLTDYMAEHESKIDRSIASYEADASHTVLDTWLQFGSEDEISRRVAAAFDCSMTPEQIANAAIDIEKDLVGLYRELSDATSVPELQELFESLITLEENKGRQYARAVSEMLTG